MSQFHLWLLLIQLLLLCFCCLAEYMDADKQWDVLIFTQHWPITVCMEWEKHKPINNCTLPPKENLWTIHGIWPTKIGSKGPEFCNKSATFNPLQLEPILPDLELYWMNIEANTPLYSFWKHEWKKHGTCAAELPEFSDELKYFHKGLEWIQEFGMNVILTHSDIKPQHEGYFVDDIFYAIKSTLNISAYISCNFDHKFAKPLLSEIHLCFDKKLMLIDCNSVTSEGFYRAHREDKILTNCGEQKIMYYNQVPPTNVENYKYSDYIDKLYSTYQLIQQIIWATL